MAIDDTGNIYIGGKDEFGFFTPDANGALNYVSLSNGLEHNQKNFSTVWKTHWTGKGVYFHTSKFLFRWDPNQNRLKVWEPGPGKMYGASFTCGGELFIRQQGIGLMKMRGDSLRLLPGGDVFAKKKAFMMTPYDNAAGVETLLIGTQASGFYIYDGRGAASFPTGADDYVMENKLLYGVRLTASPGDFALATRLGGLVIMDRQGRLKHIFDKTSGLMDDNIKYVLEDSGGNLWLAMNRGIAKIEYTSPFSFYNEGSNLPGLVLSVVTHRSQLYAGTDTGLYFLDSFNRFHRVPGLSSYCYSLLSVGNDLLAATANGLFRVNPKHQVNRVPVKGKAYVLHRSRKEPDRVWAGLERGLVSLYFNTGNPNQQGQWRLEHQFEDIDLEIRTVVEDKKGDLWLGTLTKGALHVAFASGEQGPPELTNRTVTRYDTSHGLASKEVHAFMAGGHVMFATADGIYRFDETNRRFIPDSTLGEAFAGGTRGVFLVAEDKNKHIWFHSKRTNFRAVPGKGGVYALDYRDLRRLPPVQVNTIYPDPGGEFTWFGGNNGLVRYRTESKNTSPADFSSLIRNVEVNGNPLLYDAGNFKYIPGNDWTHSPPVIPFKDRNLRFTFAAPFFHNESRTQYRYLLEGYDPDWSDWSSETRKDYTNIDSGFNRFRVQARNVYGDLSREAVFQFRVLPPWYNTWWAYLGYLLSAFLGVYMVVRWRSGKLVKEKQKLEGIVKERTKEIEQKNLQLKEQSVKLQKVAKIKSRFFANISHEFRTPLTLIIGPLEQVLDDYRGKDPPLEKKAELMLRNSQRLLNLINQLLDLSKFDSGRMRLHASRQDIVPFLKGILAAFQLLVTQKNIQLTLHAEKETISLYFDREKLEQAMGNILLNAVKFTPSGGKITVNVNVKGRFLALSVRDTGVGISSDQLAHVFDRFYQAETSDGELPGQGHKGSGIGLALAKELVDLHRGKIDVHSRGGEGKDSGTEFVIRLPMGDGHLKPHEMPGAPAADKGAPAADKGVPVNVSINIPLHEIPVEMEDTPPESGLELEAGAGANTKERILVVEDNAEVR
ncbi:MAG: hypothetical protein GY940_08760, partial [bacterium]|nr:hypothetical protein [bacterium]